MFDPYHKWLGIPKDRRPPTYYDLLGITPTEDDVEVIDSAALRQIAHVRTFQSGPHGQDCARLLNELAVARRTLTSPDRRTKYDAKIAAGVTRVIVEIDEDDPLPLPPRIQVAEEPLSGEHRRSPWVLPAVVLMLMLAGLVFLVVANKGRVTKQDRPSPGPTADTTKTGGGEPEHPTIVTTQPPAPPTEVAVASPAPAPVPVPVQAKAPTKLDRAAILERIKPRPEDRVGEIPADLDPNTPFVEVRFDPPDSILRLICDKASLRVLTGPGRVVECYVGATKANQALLGLSRPGHEAVMDRPIRLEAGRLVTVRIKLGVFGSETSTVQVARSISLTGPIDTRDPGMTEPTPAPSLSGTPVRTIERGQIAELGSIVSSCMAVGMGPDGPRALLGCEDGILREFRLDTGQLAAAWSERSSPLKAVALDVSGRKATTGGTDGSFRVWDATTRKPLKGTKSGRFTTRPVVFSRDGRFVAAGNKNVVEIMRSEGPAVTFRFPHKSDAVSALAFSTDGERLWVAWEHELAVFDMTLRKPFADQGPLAALFKKGPPILALAAHPDGRRLMIARADGQVQALDWSTGELKGGYAPQEPPATGLALSSDGKHLLTYGGDHTIRVWDVDAGQLLARLEGHTDRVFAAAFVPDESGLAVASLGAEPTLRVWDLEMREGAPKRPWAPDDPKDLTKGIATKSDGR